MTTYFSRVQSGRSKGFVRRPNGTVAIIEDVVEGLLSGSESTQSGSAVSVEFYGAKGDGSTGDSAAINAAFAAVMASGQTLIFSAKTYAIDSPLTLSPPTGGTVSPTGGANIIVAQGTIFKATASMTTMLTIGSIASDYSGQVNRWTLSLGTWDCNFLATNAVRVAFAANCVLRDTNSHNHSFAGFWGGNPASPAASFEILFDNCRTYRSLAYKTITGITKANPAVVTCPGHGYSNGQQVYLQGVAGMTQVNAGYFTVASAGTDTFALSGINSTGYSTYTSGGTASRTLSGSTIYGIYYDNSTDSQAANCVLIGNTIGIGRNAGGSTGAWDGKYNACHVWNYPEHGDVVGFDLDGDNAVMGCQVDAPFQYAYRFNGPRNRIIGSEVNYTGGGAVTSYAYPIYVGASGGVTAGFCTWKAGSGAPLVAEATGAGLASFSTFACIYSNVNSYNSREATVARAHAHITGGATPVVTAGYGVSSVTRNAVGDFTIGTTNRLDSGATITMTAGSTAAATLVATERAGSRTSYAFRMHVRDLTNTLVDPDSIDVTIFSVPPSAGI